MRVSPVLPVTVFPVTHSFAGWLSVLFLSAPSPPHPQRESPCSRSPNFSPPNHSARLRVSSFSAPPSAQIPRPARDSRSRDREGPRGDRGAKGSTPRLRNASPETLRFPGGGTAPAKGFLADETSRRRSPAGPEAETTGGTFRSFLGSESGSSTRQRRGHFGGVGGLTCASDSPL